MIYITGDTHGNFRRFEKEYFPAGQNLCRDDYVIVCGDFGIWDETPQSNKELDWLNDQPFTTLFIDGNHENFDLINRFAVMQWKGGSVHQVREHILHLMRGQVFDIGGMTFFTMGGAASHDISAGILEPDAPDFLYRKRVLDRRRALYRINHISWWKEEMPCDEEYETALKKLENSGWRVDCVLTHCAPDSIATQVCHPYKVDRLTNFLETVKSRCSFDYWFFGHYHDNRTVEGQFILQWEQMVEIR
jgi:DNA repair exonuclease SbcCD nuclease subunit